MNYPIPTDTPDEERAPPQPSMVLKIAVGLVTTLSLIILFVGARHNYQSGEESRMIGYVIGGVVIWPGLITLLFSISKKHRSPRRACRVWLVTSLILCLGNLSNIAVSKSRAERAHEQEVFSSLRESKIDNLEEMIEVEDLDRLVEIQQKSREDFEAGISQLDGDAAKGAQAAATAMRPLMDATAEYTSSAAEFFTLVDQTIQTAQSATELEALLVPLADLNAEHNQLIHLLDNFETDAKKIIAGLDLSTRERQQIMQGIEISFGPQKPYLKTVRRTDAEMLEHYREWIVLLSSRWFEWELDEDGNFLWSTDEGLNAHNEFVGSITEIAQEQEEAQQGLLAVARKL
ncbi:MAG: hypothetical protein SynsKO_29600 [Synoicihabitans sp.]